jgi:protocatechuate 3,4-dioxygenase beta subunit
MFHDHHDVHDLGLQADLGTLLRQQARRRHALRWLAGGSLGALLAACGGGGGDSTATGTDSSSSGSSSGGSSSGGSSSSSGTCSVIPEETAGPYPGDGSNTSGGSVANALALSGIVRSDIRSSFAGASGTAAGVPLTVTLTLVNTNGSCAPLAGYAIYLWHCDALGRYSMYSSAIADENYLRGVQVTDVDGQLTFTTIVPGCYSGRWPHMHFEVYRSEATATSFRNKLKTSQLALPQSVCETVYAQSDYPGSATNLSRISLSSDNVFSDGVTTQMASVTGSVAAGYVATLQVGIAV